MACKGICGKYKAQKPKDGGRYFNGQKRCQACEIFIVTDSLFCPCCNHRLRNKPRNSKLNEILRVKNRI